MAGDTENWMILQVADSSFPTGGFAHSGGLESAWQMGWVSDGEALESWLRAQLGQVMSAMGPFVREAFECPDHLGEVDAVCEAFLSNHVARRASAVQGQAFVLACSKAFGDQGVSRILKQVRGKEIVGHFAPVFGATLATMGFQPDEALRLFTFINMRGWISAAVRLGIVGPLEGQRVQWRVVSSTQYTPSGRGSRRAESHSKTTAQEPRPFGGPVQTAPVLDLLQGVQDRLYTRLFQS
jgi:urease accessory protein